MKTLVTGGSGFVGLNVVETLLARGDEVIVLDDGDFPAHPSRTFTALPGTLKAVRADVADGAAVDAVFAEHRPEAVVHAAVITAGEQRELTDFDRVVEVNVKGTAHVLSAAAEHGARKVVYVSSGSAYGQALLEGDTVSEETPPQPDTLYAITKYASERIGARFRQLRGLDVVSTRLGSVFGPWERDTGVRDTLSLPFQIVQLAAAGKDVLLSQHEPRRDWIYSRDVAAGIARILDAPHARYDVYNLSSGVAWSRFAENWCSHLKPLFPALRYRSSNARETPNVSFLGERDRAMMSIDRVRSETGFRPAFDDSNVFADYAAWLGRNMSYYDADKGAAEWKK